MERADVEVSDKETLEAWTQTGVGASLQQTATVIKLATCRKTFDAEYYRIQFNAGPETSTVTDILLRYMVKDGGDVKHNAQPKGPRERRLESLLKKGGKDDDDE